MRNLRFIDCSFAPEKPDVRPCMVVQDADSVALERCALKSPPGAALIAVRGTLGSLAIRGCPGLRDRTGTLSDTTLSL